MRVVRLLMVILVCFSWTALGDGIKVLYSPVDDAKCDEAKLTFAVYGASGETGATVVDYLLAQEQKVIVVTRPNSPWAKVEGVTVREVKDVMDVDDLAKAFADIDGAFVLPSLPYKSNHLIGDALKAVQALRKALEKADVPKLVVVSSIGAHLDPQQVSLGHIEASYHVEKEFQTLPSPVTFLRPAWLVDNFKILAKSIAEKQGILPSFLTDVDKKREMVTSFDVGVWGAKLLFEKWDGIRVIELQGPDKASPNDVAKAVAKALTLKDGKERTIKAIPISKEKYSEVFKSVMSPDSIGEWAKTIEGLNSGKIKFEGGASRTVLGETSVEDFVKTWFEDP